MIKIAVIGIIGESVFMPVEHFHVGGETVESLSLHKELGGKGCNQAIASKRFGANVSFLTAINKKDEEEFSQFLNRQGIYTKFAIKKEESPYAVIITDKTGTNHVTEYVGAKLTANDVNEFEEEIKTADVLLLSNEVPEEVNCKAVQIAKANNVYIILNPAPTKPLCKFLIDNVDLFTPNEHETHGLENKNNVIITLGKRGCKIKEKNLIIDAYDFGKVVDTTGAGDTFNGVLAVALTEFKSTEKACKLANVAASLSVTRYNVVDAIPFREEIFNLL